ncbi:MAG: outer membrane protein assembly factor BamA [Nitrospinota bacterium]|nr:outer membrane protein assembly factor BamA [Nitrospinota bacterium]
MFFPARAFVFLSLFVFVLALTSSSVQSKPSPPAITIKAIEIKGNVRVDRSTILFHLGLKVGKSYKNNELVDQTRSDVRKVFSLGFFRDVKVEVKSFEGGLRVIYRVIEKPTITSIIITGNSRVSSDDIRELLTIKTQTIVNKSNLNTTLQNVRRLYEEKGYFFAKIEAILKSQKKNKVKITLNIDEGDSVRIESIKFQGNNSFSKRKLLRIIDINEEGFFSYFTDSGIYTKEILQSDLAKIEAHYQSNGYIKAQIGQPIIKKDVNRNKLTIIIPITEGKVFSIGKIKIIGGEKIIPKSELEKQLKMFEGDIFDRSIFRSDIRKIRNSFSEFGYAYVTVKPLIDVDEVAQKVDLTIKIDTKHRVYIRNINIEGNTRTRDNVIRRNVRVVEGGLYNSKDLAITRKRLGRLGFFSKIAVKEEDVSGKENLMDIDIKIKEQPTGSITGGMTLSSESGAGIMGQVKENNLFGRGYNTSLKGSLTDQDIDFVGTFTDPDFMDKGFSFGGDLFFEDQEYDSFDSRREGGRIGIGKEIFEFMNVFLSYEFSATKVTNAAANTHQDILDFENKTRLESKITPWLRYDSRDSRGMPTEGIYFKLVPALSGGFLGADIDMFSFENEFQYFKSIGRDLRIRSLKKLVLKSHVNLRYVDTFNGKVPGYRRLYSKGYGKGVRGYRSDDLGPKDTQGNAIGGLSAALLSLELRHPFIGPTSVSIFTDAGNVWERHNAFDLGDLRYSAGVGLSFITPLGPMRVDMGYKLDTKTGERSRESHVQLGVGF